MEAAIRMKRDNADEGMKLDWCLHSGKFYCYLLGRCLWTSVYLMASGLILRKIHHCTNISLSLFQMPLEGWQKISQGGMGGRLSFGLAQVHGLEMGGFLLPDVYISEAGFSFRTFWLVSHPG